MEFFKGRRRFCSESPSRALPSLAELIFQRRGCHRRRVAEYDMIASMSGGVLLPPLMEGPDGGEGERGRRREGWRWRRGRDGGGGGGGGGGSDMQLLLTVMATPLGIGSAEVADGFCRLGVKDCPMEALSAQYILEQYIGVTGGLKLLSSIRNSYATGKVKMVALEFETARTGGRNCHASRDAECGAFVLWQMSPNMWHIELAVGETKVSAGCNGELIWRHTPWYGAHLAEGPVRPIRRSLQGLDPLTTASVFATAQYVGEKVVGGEECYVLKVSADAETLEARSEGRIQVTQHNLFGHFSVKTGFLIHMVDSCMTRVEANPSRDLVYWETTISSFLDDYHPVDGVMIAHSGRSTFTLFMFGDEAMSLAKMRMEESWSIDEVAFNVHGLSVDLFIPPADLPQGEKCCAR